MRQTRREIRKVISAFTQYTTKAVTLLCYIQRSNLPHATAWHLPSGPRTLQLFRYVNPNHAALSTQPQPKSEILVTIYTSTIMPILWARGWGDSLVMGYWGCAAGWGRIFTTRLTKIGFAFSSIFNGVNRMWPHFFWEFKNREIICPKLTKIGFIIGHKIYHN